MTKIFKLIPKFSAKIKKLTYCSQEIYLLLNNVLNIYSQSGWYPHLLALLFILSSFLLSSLLSFLFFFSSFSLPSSFFFLLFFLLSHIPFYFHSFLPFFFLPFFLLSILSSFTFSLQPSSPPYFPSLLFTVNSFSNLFLPLSLHFKKFLKVSYMFLDISISIEIQSTYKDTVCV